MFGESPCLSSVFFKLYNTDIIVNIFGKVFAVLNMKNCSFDSYTAFEVNVIRTNAHSHTTS